MVKVGGIYFMRKTGSKVKAIKESTPKSGLPCWTIEYLNGSWKGKAQIATERALVCTLAEANSVENRTEVTTG